MSDNVIPFPDPIPEHFKPFLEEYLQWGSVLASVATPRVAAALLRVQADAIEALDGLGLEDE